MEEVRMGTKSHQKIDEMPESKAPSKINVFIYRWQFVFKNLVNGSSYQTKDSFC